jgi:hypothetical protein
MGICTLNLKHAILNDVFSCKPKNPLYHYTTQTGLLGIIKDRQIWATHTQYLNDRREFLHAVDLVRGEVQRLLDQRNTGQEAASVARIEALKRMREMLLMSPEQSMYARAHSPRTAIRFLSGALMVAHLVLPSAFLPRS